MLRANLFILAGLAALAIAACGAKPQGPGGGAASSSGQGGLMAPASSSSVPVTSAIGSGGGGLTVNVPPQFTITGTVVDQDGKPLAGAIVLQAGRSTEPTLLSGADGSFTLGMVYDGQGTPTAVATQSGYRTAGAELMALPEQPIQLKLYAVNPPDNEGYAYLLPGKGNDPSTGYCGHCHDTFAAEFQTSKHAQATRDPLVQAVYAGVTEAFADQPSCQSAGGSWRNGLVPGTQMDAAPKCYLGGGVLPDLNPSCGGKAQLACDDPALDAGSKPTAFGACADCHSPGMAGKAGDRNLLDAVGVAYDDGVHCDFCHHVADVDLTKPPGAGKRLIVQRPSEHIEGDPLNEIRQAMFGPLLDVPNPFMNGVYQPKFATALLCAGCHQQDQPALVPGDQLAARFAAGLPVHTTYAEWLAGPYAAANLPCRHCHMPADFDLDSTTDLGNAMDASITFGFPRPADQIREHIFRSPLTALSPEGPRLIDTAIATVIDATVNGADLDVGVALGNIGCGHAVPTGEPMRALVMLVSASCNGAPLTAIGGMTVNDAGGARARGVVGADASVGGMTLTWAAGAALAKMGDVVRIVRPSGQFDDYDGIGLFSGSQLAPADKGLPILEPVGRATVASVNGGAISLAAPIAAQAGDVVYLGDAAAFVDGQPSGAFAGEAGYTFAKVLVDGKGNRQAPHYRAIDIASDNRIAPAKTQHTSHRFAIPNSCAATDATVAIFVLYRPVPIATATLRGYKAQDYLISQSSKKVAVP